MWGYIHMMPDEVVQAAIDLKTKVLMPVHWSKFTLALHPWNEPIKKVSIKAKEMKMPITTPLIGEVVTVNQHYPDSIWWEF
jgi:L-ascorbate metabolism protein UlaG (beta-lactamase superfamily)